MHKINAKQAVEKTNKTMFFVKNQMSSAYRVGERVLRQCKVTRIRRMRMSKLSHTFITKVGKVHNLVMRNKITQKSDKLKRTNVISKYSCPDVDCMVRNADYIGLTTNTLSRRLTMHIREGAPYDHTSQTHNRYITRACVLTLS